MIVRDDGFGAGLLEPQFADPDGVRIARVAPGKIAMAVGVPGEQEAADLVNDRGGLAHTELGGFQSMTRSHSATTAKPSGSTSHGSNSGFRGSRRICSCCHSSWPVTTLRLV